MDFGEAIKVLKSGGRVCRSGWNGKGMWLALSGNLGGRRVHKDALWSIHARMFAVTQEGEAALVQPCIIMKTAQDQIQMGWLASQSDMLAEDWEEITAFDTTPV